jgi:hypothetical protein
MKLHFSQKWVDKVTSEDDDINYVGKDLINSKRKLHMRNYLNNTGTFTMVVDFFTLLISIGGLIDFINYKFVTHDPGLISNIAVVAFVVAVCSYARQINK